MGELAKTVKPSSDQPIFVDFKFILRKPTFGRDTFLNEKAVSKDTRNESATDGLHFSRFGDVAKLLIYT